MPKHVSKRTARLRAAYLASLVDPALAPAEPSDEKPKKSNTKKS